MSTTTAKAPRSRSKKRQTPTESPVFPEAARGIVTAQQVAKLAAAGLVIERAGVIGMLRRDLQAAKDATHEHPAPKCDGSCMPALDEIATLVGESEGDGIWSTTTAIVEGVRRVAGEAAEVERLRAEVARLTERVSFWELSAEPRRRAREELCACGRGMRECDGSTIGCEAGHGGGGGQWQVSG